jgi:hypothetical protein
VSWHGAASRRIEGKRMNQPNPGTTGAGEASGKHQGLRQPADDERVEDAVDNIGLSDRGERMEDHLRDRNSKGARDGYDDSIGHDVASQFVEDGAVDPLPPPA